MALYKIFNGAMPTTAGFVAVTTGTAIKTLLQVKPGATRGGRIVEWGINFSGFAAAAPILTELLQTDVAATVTAHAAAGIMKYDPAALMNGDPTTDAFSVGTTATGFTASAEGSITAVRLFDVQQIAPSGQFVFPVGLGREAFIEPAKFGRIRVTAAAAVNAVCWMLVEI